MHLSAIILAAAIPGLLLAQEAASAPPDFSGVYDPVIRLGRRAAEVALRPRPGTVNGRRDRRRSRTAHRAARPMRRC